MPTPARGPNGIVAGADGKLWFTELATHQIGQMTPQGELTEFALPVDGTPIGIAAGADGNVWVTVPAARAVCRLTPNGHGNAFHFAGDVLPSLITAGPDTNLWFTEPNGKIGRLTTSGFLTEFPSTPDSPPERSAPSPGVSGHDGDRLLITPP